ncbi:MAG TPA: hypothetical protein VFA78_08475 [Chloroflexota bacterium]|nr:hypothetical protein [Chloroflexota bacterium]
MASVEPTSTISCQIYPEPLVGVFDMSGQPIIASQWGARIVLVKDEDVVVSPRILVEERGFASRNDAYSWLTEHLCELDRGWVPLPSV